MVCRCGHRGYTWARLHSLYCIVLWFSQPLPSTASMRHINLFSSRSICLTQMIDPANGDKSGAWLILRTTVCAILSLPASISQPGKNTHYRNFTLLCTWRWQTPTRHIWPICIINNLSFKSTSLSTSTVMTAGKLPISFASDSEKWLEIWCPSIADDWMQHLVWWSITDVHQLQLGRKCFICFDYRSTLDYHNTVQTDAHAQRVSHYCTLVTVDNQQAAKHHSLLTAFGTLLVRIHSAWLSTYFRQLSFCKMKLLASHSFGSYWGTAKLFSS